MARSPTEAASPTPATGWPSATTQTVVSFLLFLHLFLLGIGLAGTAVKASALERSLYMLGRSGDARGTGVQLVRGYLQLLLMNLSYQFNYTDLRPIDGDLAIELELKLPSGETRTVRLPEADMQPRTRALRYRRLAFELAQAEELPSGEVLTALVSEAVVARMVRETGATGGRILFRMADPAVLDAALEQMRTSNRGPAAPYDPAALQVVYEAQILVQPGGAIGLVPKEAEGEAAPARTRP